MKARQRKRSRSAFRMVLLKVSLSSRLSDIPRVGDGCDSIPVVPDFARYIVCGLPSIPTVGDSAPTVDISQCAREKNK